jgi:hypothetical protein
MQSDIVALNNVIAKLQVIPHPGAPLTAMLVDAQARVAALGSATDGLLTPINATGFPHFSRLPGELRFKIWGMVLPESRIVEVVFKLLDYDEYEARVTTKPSALFFVSKEARQVATSKYTQLISGRIFTNAAWFEPRKDIVYIMWDISIDWSDWGSFFLSLNAYWDKDTLDNIHHLALDDRVKLYTERRDLLTYLAPQLRQLPNLTRIAHEMNCRMPYSTRLESRANTGELTFLDTANLAHIWIAECSTPREKVYEYNGERSSLPGFKPHQQVLVKLCARDGQLCCNAEGCDLPRWRSVK